MIADCGGLGTGEDQSSGRRGMFRLVVPGLEACLTRRVGFPALGLSSMLIQAMACPSYSRLPHMSHIQAGKFVTVINSSPSQVK